MDNNITTNHEDWSQKAISHEMKEEKYSISVVIPTADRSKQLQDALEKVREQSCSVSEIVIVDSSTDTKTWKIVERARNKFVEKRITVKYFWEPKISISHARNTGLKKAKSNYVMFLDDDMILSERYIEELMNVFKKHPQAIGVEGNFPFWKNITYRTKLLMIARRFFLVTYWWPNTQMILESGDYIRAEPLTTVIGAEFIWIQGSVFKKDLLSNFWFDEKLKGYSYGEDVDFTMRLNKRYPNSLFVTPHAKSTHNRFTLERINLKKIRAHELYLFRKNMGEFDWTWFSFFRRNLGIILLSFIDLKMKDSRLDLFKIFDSYVWVIRHFSSVIRGDF